MAYAYLQKRRMSSRWGASKWMLLIWRFRRIVSGNSTRHGPTRPLSKRSVECERSWRTGRRCPTQSASGLLVMGRLSRGGRQKSKQTEMYQTMLQGCEDMIISCHGRCEKPKDSTNAGGVNCARTASERESAKHQSQPASRLSKPKLQSTKAVTPRLQFVLSTSSILLPSGRQRTDSCSFNHTLISPAWPQ